MALNPQHDSIDALKFAVEFAQRHDLQELQEPQLGRLWRDLKVFTGDPVAHASSGIGLHGPAGFVKKSAAAQTHIVRSAVLDAWAGIGDLLRIALDGSSSTGAAFVDLVTNGNAVRVSVTVGKGPSGLQLSGPLRAVAILRLQSLLAGAEGLRVKRCRCDGCDVVFVKVTRKEFCSTRCQSRFYMRQKRREEQAEQKKRIGGRFVTKTRSR